MKAEKLSRRHRQAQQAYPRISPSYLDGPDPDGDCDQRVMLTDTPDIHTVTCGCTAVDTITLTCPSCTAVTSGAVCGDHYGAVWLCIACWYGRDAFAEMTPVFEPLPPAAEREPADLLGVLASMGASA